MTVAVVGAREFCAVRTARPLTCQAATKERSWPIVPESVPKTELHRSNFTERQMP